jgi:L-fucose isomerase-like protein
MTALRVALVRSSLPSYFPERHGVYEAVELALNEIVGAVGGAVHVYPEIPMDGRAAQAAVDWCRAEAIDFALLLHGGFTMGDVARTFAASDLKLGFWATPEPVLEGDVQLNSFVSLNMSLSIARTVRDLRARPVQWYYGDPGAPELRARLGNSIRALALVTALRGARIGIVGGLAPTFYNMEVSTGALRAGLAVEVENHDMGELVGRLGALDPSRVEAELALMLAAAPARGLPDDQMRLTAEVALALRDLAREHACDALAVSDWPELQRDPGMHPGAAFSWLEETDRLPVASEGDVMGAVSQLVCRELTGRVGYLLDMTAPDPEDDSILVWHGGGGPLYLADEDGAAWIAHPMIGRGNPQARQVGAILSLRFRPGPVTLFRVGQSGALLFSAEAEIRTRPQPGFDGVRGWAGGFSMGGAPASANDIVATVMANGLEHHFTLAEGRHGAVLEEFGAWTGQRIVEPSPYRRALRATDYH